MLNELEEYVSEQCIFASNTFFLPIEHIASSSRRPDKVIHYQRIELGVNLTKL